MLELDLVLERFFAQRFDALSPAEIDAYKRILDLPDTDFLDVVNGKADLDDPEEAAIIEILRSV
ncbi:YgfY protein [Aquitalea magnusonii]|uniref:FAD assembly factor SdhE n=1 Tax=Aquitalea magnusonii TaxID=332411 RepID=A0A3G9G969_9NEIS|nr:YgfY protein [Aquitalea magnusonii]